MRLCILLISLCSLFGVNAQLSYDFANPLPPQAQKVNTVDRSNYGYYTSKNAGIDYEITVKGIFIVSTIFSSITRETIRESSKYRVENGYLFGIKENDSIPCILEGDSYLFGIKTRELIAGESSKNVLTRISDKSYILNFEEKGHYTPTLLEFKGKSLTVRHFTYENSTEVFNRVKERSETEQQGLTYITLEPTLAEWQAFAQKDILGEKVVFNVVLE